MRPMPKLAALALAAPLLVSAPAVPGEEQVVADLYLDGALAHERKDYEQAARLFREAAEQGDAPAQEALGKMYARGEGVPQDFREAAHWLRKAAEQGRAFAQYALGALYDEGRGVPQDFREGARWLRKAAEQGREDAQAVLGALYSKGRGVPQDYVQAYAWSNLAAAAGHEKAKELRDLVLGFMTPEQVTEGQALSRELAAKLRE